LSSELIPVDKVAVSEITFYRMIRFWISSVSQIKFQKVSCQVTLRSKKKFSHWLHIF